MNDRVFVSGNPINAIDPLGLFEAPEFGDEIAYNMDFGPGGWKAPPKPESPCVTACLLDRVFGSLTPFGILPFDINFLGYSLGFQNDFVDHGLPDAVGTFTGINAAKWGSLNNALGVGENMAKGAFLLNFLATIYDLSDDLAACKCLCGEEN